MKAEDITIREIAHHRNGISGEPFAVVTFTWNDDGVARPMLGVLFPNDRPERPGGFVNPRTAVLDRERLHVGIIGFMENSWRGDAFDPYLRPAVAEYLNPEETEMSARMIDDAPGEPVEVAPEDVPPIGLVYENFVELDEGVYIRAAAVTRVLHTAPLREGGKVYHCNVVQGEGGERNSTRSLYPVHKVLQALNIALENGRARRIERAEY